MRIAQLQVPSRLSHPALVSRLLAHPDDLSRHLVVDVSVASALFCGGGILGCN